MEAKVVWEKETAMALTLAEHVLDEPMLDAVLGGVFGEGASAESGVTIVSRQPIANYSTYGGEIVTCRLVDGQELRVFCKFGTDAGDLAPGDHRMGLAYAAEVHRRILETMPLPKPRFYGTSRDPQTSRIGVVVEALEESESLNEVGGLPSGTWMSAIERLLRWRGPFPCRVALRLALCPLWPFVVTRRQQPFREAMIQAAHWIGRFHAETRRRLTAEPLPFLRNYGPEHYRALIRRTLELSASLHERFGWLPPLCHRCEEFLPATLATDPTVIHGEYYPPNILVRRGVVYPVDWESAAIAAGEIDLACLTEKGSPKVERLCRRAYQQARWPEGPPADFEKRLLAARIYVLFRELADEPNLPTDEGALRSMASLRCLAARAGLI